MRKYQLLVLFGAALYGAWFFMPYLFTYDADTERLLSYSGFGAKLNSQQPLVFVPFFLWRLFATIGLLLFFTWGRNLFALWLIADIGLTIMGGVVVYSALDSALGYLSIMLDGAVTALAFFGSKSHLFTKDG